MANSKWACLDDHKALFVPKPYGEAKWKLYNLKTDPGEKTDLSTDKVLYILILFFYLFVCLPLGESKQDYPLV